jgi:lipopolysaccharide export system protein LptC
LSSHLQSALLLATALLAIVSYWWRDGVERAAPQPLVAGLIDAAMSGYRATQMGHNGLPSHRLVGDELTHYRGDSSTELVSPRLQLFRDSGEPWLISSEGGWLSGDQSLLLLQGTVRIRREAGADRSAVAVDTSNLRVHPNDQFAETDQLAVIVTDTLEMAGVGMRAFLADSRLQILDQVRSRHVPNSSISP